MIMTATTTVPTNRSPPSNEILNRRIRSNSINSPAVESVIDAHASRILRINSPAEACIDPALGPYVTSIFRCALLNDEGNKLELDDIEEVDSLLELLEEHCIMDRESAKNALLNIYITVKTGVVDDIFGSRHSSMRRRRGMSAGNEEEAIRLLGQMLRGSDMTNTVKDHQTFALGEGVKSSYSPSSESDAGFMFELDDLLGDAPLMSNSEDMKRDLFHSNQSTVMNNFQDVHNLLPATPLKPTTLIPADLLGVLDNPSTPATIVHFSEQKKEIIDPANMETPRVQNTEKKQEDLNSPWIESSEQTVPVKQHDQNHSKSKTSLAQDLAATLFKPTRSRSNSILSDKRSPKYRPLQAPSNICQTVGNFNLNPTNNDPLLESSVEILLSLNSNLSEEAAFEAARVTNNDVNVAQYILEQAIAAPPICRHMLNNACYRSDCQFSHDVEGHTCKFWLKGRCGKKDKCRFLHGFSEQLLEGMIKITSNEQTINSQTKPLNIPITTTNLVQHNMSSCSPQPFSFLSSSLDSKNSFNAAEAFGGGAFSLPLPQSLIPPSTPISTPIQNSFPTAAMQNRYNSMMEPKYKYENNNLPEKNINEKPKNEIDNFPSIQHEKSPLAQKTKNPKPTSHENSKTNNDKSKRQSTFSFAKVASQGYKKELSFSVPKDPNNINKPCPALSNNTNSTSINNANKTVKYAKIPPELLNAHYGRNSTFFQISDPLERYYEVSYSSNNHHQRKDVIDLRFQSIKTFPVVLSRVLPEKLMQKNDVWIITVSGSNANRNFYQKSGSVLETAVLRWLSGKGYEYMKGKDKNGFGGAILVKGRR